MIQSIRNAAAALCCVPFLTSCRTAPGAVRSAGAAGAPPAIVIPTPPIPAIHGARIVGATPGRPFLFLIPATGQAPLTYAATALPKGLSLSPTTGIISGSLASKGVFHTSISVIGPKGTAREELTIVGGTHRLALTPPMGWNSWNVWGGAVSDSRVRQAADWMVRSGLARHGYQYINIDDGWEGRRDASGNITGNSKFPDMKTLAAYIHSKGLKLGIYSSPGPTTCEGYPGSYQHERQDARAYARWGIDYLKYDWCSYAEVVNGTDLFQLQKPYLLMRRALDGVNRDIVFSLCQYGVGNVWTWGARVGGNSWRTTRDISDSWRSLNRITFSQNGHERYASPGHWNDPDMLVVGRIGWGKPHPTHLLPDEQLLHVSMWCLQAAPLLIGCDLSRLDPFTRALLTNDEVVAVDQDSLGRPASMISQGTEGQLQVWARPLFDGTRAVGLFNRLAVPAVVTARWSALGIKGAQPVRDLWRHKNLGTRLISFSAVVPRHGVVLVKIGAPH